MAATSENYWKKKLQRIFGHYQINVICRLRFASASFAVTTIHYASTIICMHNAFIIIVADRSNCRLLDEIEIKARFRYSVVIKSRWIVFARYSYPFGNELPIRVTTMQCISIQYESLCMNMLYGSKLLLAFQWYGNALCIVYVCLWSCIDFVPAVQMHLYIVLHLPSRSIGCDVIYTSPYIDWNRFVFMKDVIRCTTTKSGKVLYHRWLCVIYNLCLVHWMWSNQMENVALNTEVLPWA